MRSLLRTGLVVLAAGALLYVVAVNGERLGLDKVSLPWNARPASTDPEQLPGGTTIRIASFNIQAFGQSKLEKKHVMQRLAEVARRFDVVAIQEVRSKQQDVLPRLVEEINGPDGRRKYDFALSERLGRTNSQEQYAFVFDTDRIEIDRRYTYTVVDRGDRLHREPFVAWFRVRGPPPDKAFTFTLINIHTDPDEVDQELGALDDVYRAVQCDGSGEDDVILLGDLNTHAGRLGELARIPYLACAIVELKTNTRQDKQYDNILFHSQATQEFTGRSGVLDLETELGLTRMQALEISDHLPIWAEFSAYEGGKPGYVIGRVGTEP
jgi:endonuclease/exonuclease/phosphatase family metal-dependent hydrolase